MTVKVKIIYHSAIDIITNSSTEIFCKIVSNDFIKEIASELSLILDREVIIDDYDFDDGNHSITFDIEYGDNIEVCNDFCAMLEYILNDKIGIGNFIIDRNASY